MGDGTDLDPEMLRPSGALLAAQIALGTAIDNGVIAASGTDATTADLLVRLHLAADHSLRAVELCRQLLKSPSHISRRIDRAEEEGFVRREPDPDDRRARLVVLTDAGREVVSRLAPLLTRVLRHSIFDTLDADEIDTLVDLLQRIEAGARGCVVPDNS
ncbi:MAG: MarR family transcriptional regulator [Acidimicrobiia bacterium]|nr:MarR family transcriptional regulator [Acidimicrobiia bacterium]